MYLKKNFSLQNFLPNIPLILSGGAFAALFVTSMSSLPLAAGIFAAICITAFFLKDVFSFWKSNLSFLSVLLTAYILTALSQKFYSEMLNSKTVQKVGARLSLEPSQLLLLLAIAGWAVAFYFLSAALMLALRYFSDADRPQLADREGNSAPSVTREQLLCILLTAIVTMTICTKSSPLYPFNDWVDSNCFLTVGKSMLHGLVPYRDLYEQKGPLLYMLHALAALVSETSFLGVYLIEIVACATFLLLGYLTVRLYFPSASIATVPITSAVIYTAHSFCHGDSAEELCLPFLAYAIYVGLKAVHQKQMPTKLECLAIGVTSACVLWIKYTMLGFYLGWICVPAVLLLKNKRAKDLFQMLLLIAAGVALLSAPILIYFAVNHALTDLWTAYFYNNLFSYSNLSTDVPFVQSILNNLNSGMTGTFTNSFAVVVALITGGAVLVSKKEKVSFCMMVTSFLGTFLLVFAGGRHYTYYSFIFFVFAPLGLAALVELARALFGKLICPDVWKRQWKNCVCLLCAVVSVAYTCHMSDNTYLIQYSKPDLPQYQFAEIIAQVEDATLLNYGFLDGGFYTTTGIVPTCKYFCKLNIGLDEMMETQNEYVQQGKVDFVVTQNAELDSEIYENVAQSVFYFEGTERTYYLYQLVQ